LDIRFEGCPTFGVNKVWVLSSIQILPKAQ
jgi:hypothetical protein